MGNPRVPRRSSSRATASSATPPSDTYVRLQQRGRATTCVEINFYGAFAGTSRSTPSTRRLLDGVAGWVSHARRSQHGRVIAVEETCLEPTG